MIRVGAPRDMPVYFPAFAGTELYCLVTEAVGCEQLAYGCYAAASRLGLEPATTRSQVRRPTTKPPRHPAPKSLKICVIVMFDLPSNRIKLVQSLIDSATCEIHIPRSIHARYSNRLNFLLPSAKKSSKT